MQGIWSQMGYGPSVLLVLAVVLLAGFGATRLTNLLRLPKVSGYILAGILIGPHLLGLIPQSAVDGMDFVNTILQVVGGAAAVYTLGADSAAVYQKENVVGADGAKVA